MLAKSLLAISLLVTPVTVVVATTEKDAASSVSVTSGAALRSRDSQEGRRGPSSYTCSQSCYFDMACYVWKIFNCGREVPG